MNDWIPVTERLPDNKSQVLTYGENGYATRIYFNGDWFNEHAISTMNTMGDIEDITHWALLPEPPENDNE